MSSGWIAAQVRSRGLARHRLGGLEARRLAGMASLSEALSSLAVTPYGTVVRPDMDLVTAQRAVSNSVLWNLRVLAGWAPPLGGGIVRLLAGGFELANITAQGAKIAGQQAPEMFALGSLATVRGLGSARDLGDLRRALAASPWGDPGVDDLAGTRLALELGLARGIAQAIPEAAALATSAAVLIIARSIAAGAPPAAGTPAAGHARAVLGKGWVGAPSVEQLRRTLAPRLDWVLEGASSAEDLWRCEVRWWSRLEAESLVLTARALPGPGAVVGVAGLLSSDGWQVRAALEIAARGGRDAGVLDDVA